MRLSRMFGKEINDSIVTNRLILRPFKVGDKEALYRIFSDEEMVSLAQTPYASDLIDAQELIYLFNAVRNYCVLAIVLKKTGEVIGSIKFEQNYHFYETTYELGYIMLRNKQGRGYMSEAVMGLAQTLFNFDAVRLAIFTSRSNQRSQGVALHCGFERGISFYKGEVLFEMTYDNMLLHKFENETLACRRTMDERCIRIKHYKALAKNEDMLVRTRMSA